MDGYQSFGSTDNMGRLTKSPRSSDSDSPNSQGSKSPTEGLAANQRGYESDGNVKEILIHTET